MEQRISDNRSPPAPASSSATTAFSTYRARFHMLAILCTFLAINAFLWVALSSLIEESCLYYGVGSVAINAVALTYQITYIPGTLLSYISMERYGLRGTVIMGGALTWVASLFRLLSSVLPSSPHGGGGGGRYAVLLVGTTLAGMAQPPLLNVPAQLAGNWFAPQERDLVTVLGTMFSPVGNALGIALPPLLVHIRKRKQQEHTSGAAEGEVHGMAVFMLGQAVVCTLALIWAACFMRSYPPTPPSESTKQRQQQAIEQGQEEEEDGKGASWAASLQEVWRVVRALWSDRDFCVILWCFGGGLAFFNALLTVLSQLLAPCGYTNEQSGTLGAVFLAAGLVGAVIAGVVLDATHRYRPMLKAGFIMATLGVVVMCLLQRPNALGPLAGAFAFLGLVMLPLLPVSIENGVECTYPVPEIYSSGLLLAAGNTIGIPFTFVYAHLLESYHGPCVNFAKPANIFVFCVLAVIVLPVLTYNGQYKRLEAERQSIIGLHAPLLMPSTSPSPGDDGPVPANRTVQRQENDGAPPPPPPPPPPPSSSPPR